MYDLHANPGWNHISGPAPLSLSKLKRLKDFELFTQAPSESLYVPRAFQERTFQRIYDWGPSVQLNNVIYNYVYISTHALLIICII